mgnify:FL=1|jgi:hypothetical protein
MIVTKKTLQTLYSELIEDSSERSIDFVNIFFYGMDPCRDYKELFLDEADYELLIDLVDYYRKGGCTHCDIPTIFEII